MELEVRHLRLLCAVAESGSLTKAAAALGMSQPGLTAQLQRIERFLGGQLFTRHRGGVTPTTLGQLVITKAQAVVPTVDELIQASMRAARGGDQQHRFRIGSINTPLLSGVIDALRLVYPECEISTRHEESIPALLDHVAAGRLEVAAIGCNPGYEAAPHPGVVVQPIITEPVFVLMPSCHPLATRSEVALAELVDDDWVLAPFDEDRTREYFATAAGYQMRVSHEASGRLLVELVRTNAGVALVQPTIDVFPGTVVRPLTGDPLHYQHAISWHSSAPLAPHSDVLIDRARKAYDAAATRNDAYRTWRAHHADGARKPVQRDDSAAPDGASRRTTGSEDT